MMILKQIEKHIENIEMIYCPGKNCCNHHFFVDARFFLLIEKLTAIIERKLVILYFFKCDSFNASIKGGNYYHSKGLAMDVDTIKTAIEPIFLAKTAWEIGFNAIGVYGNNNEPGYKGKKGMVHLGLEESPRIWGDWEINLA